MSTDHENPLRELFSWYEPEKYPKSNCYFVAAIQLVLAVAILIGWLDFWPGVIRGICALIIASVAGLNFWKGWQLPPDDAGRTLE